MADRPVASASCTSRPRRWHSVAVRLAVSVLAAAFGIPTHGQAADRGVRTSIVAGTPTSEYPAVGALLVGGDPATTVSWCSGVLVGCQTFLTAAHCVCEGTGATCQPPRAPLPNSRLVYLQHAGFFRAARITVHPAYDFPRADLAVVRLATPVTGVAPARLDDTGPPTGTGGRIVGFGSTGGGQQDLGLKRVGSITTGSCGEPAIDEEALCWTFDGDGANTCRGDSGGPLLVDLGAGPVVAGITSGGEQNGCLAADLAIDTKVATYRSWIEAVAGQDLGGDACGGIPEVGSEATRVVAAEGALDATRTEVQYTLTVPAGTNELRVALNAVDDGLSNFDLYVRAGGEATPSEHDCRADGGGQYGYCAFTFPAPGTWHILVRRVSGAGPYQVTATVGGGAPPSCGNDVRETGEACDGADDAACPGACDGRCLCAAMCTEDGLLPLGIRLGRRFSLKALLLNDDGSYDRLDPRRTDFELRLDGSEGLDIVIPADDPGWAGSDPERDAYRWRGRIPGARQVDVRCKRTRAGHWHVRVSGRADR
jgi:hypothetical protein